MEQVYKPEDSFSEFCSRKMAVPHKRPPRKDVLFCLIESRFSMVRKSDADMSSVLNRQKRHKKIQKSGDLCIIPSKKRAKNTEAQTGFIVRGASSGMSHRQISFIRQVSFSDPLIMPLMMSPFENSLSPISAKVLI